MQTIDTQAGEERGGKMFRIKVMDVLSADIHDILIAIVGALFGFMAGITWGTTAALFPEQLAPKLAFFSAVVGFFIFAGSIIFFLIASRGANKFVCLNAAFISALGGFVTLSTAHIITIIVLSVAGHLS